MLLFFNEQNEGFWFKLNFLDKPAESNLIFFLQHFTC